MASAGSSDLFLVKLDGNGGASSPSASTSPAPTMVRPTWPTRGGVVVSPGV